MIAEELGLKEISNFTQSMLREDGIYLVDFEAEAFIWVGKKVQSEMTSDAYEKAMAAMTNLHSNGCKRMRVVTLNLIFQGYEPQMFRLAFGTWNPFEKPGWDDLEIKEEREDSMDTDSDYDEQAAKGDKKGHEWSHKTINEMRHRLPNECWLN